MIEISRERRAEARAMLDRSTFPDYLCLEADDGETMWVVTKGQFRTLLDCADERDHLLKAYEDKEEALRLCSGDVFRIECERDEAVTLLCKAQEYLFLGVDEYSDDALSGASSLRQRIDALLRRVGEPE